MFLFDCAEIVRRWVPRLCIEIVQFGRIKLSGAYRAPCDQDFASEQHSGGIGPSCRGHWGGQGEHIGKRVIQLHILSTIIMTWPFGSKIAACSRRRVVIESVRVKVPVPG